MVKLLLAMVRDVGGVESAFDEEDTVPNLSVRTETNRNRVRTKTLNAFKTCLVASVLESLQSAVDTMDRTAGSDGMEQRGGGGGKRGPFGDRRTSKQANSLEENKAPRRPGKTHAG